MAKSIRELIDEYNTSGDYHSTFEAVYADAQNNDNPPPWAHMQATPNLLEWAERDSISGKGKKALVIGCGMGDDAEYLATLGFGVVAFDVSETAIEISKTRFPDSSVKFMVADLFKTPDDWHQAYDFVLENRTIQALPERMYKKTIATITNFIAPKGQILILCFGRDPDDPKDTIPWPLSSKELQSFVENGLIEVQFEDIQRNDTRRLRVLYRRD
jgi:2-polyprenyl-3-methyl-5-hydroxy-6-metoxy-1,4-benzoquinol methylase